MIIEQLSTDNLKHLTALVLELWPECVFDEEYEQYKNLIYSETEACFLVKDPNKYIAFIHLSIRNDYVEGAYSLPVAYIEAVYVQPEYQKNGIARQLVSLAERWALQKDIKQIASDTNMTNIPGIEFHKKAGFKEVERIVCFIKDL